MNSIGKSILKEHIEQFGISSLTDSEAISALTGITLSVINKALYTHNLTEISKHIPSLGITKAQTQKLELLYYLVKRINLSEYKEKTIMNSPSKAGDYFVKELQFNKNEVFVIAALDAQNRLIKTTIVTTGTINEAPVYPREIVKIALDNNAKSVILAHNHPGGSKQPSTADQETTRKIISALKTINVTVHDHIIVADNSYISFAEIGLLNS